MHWVCAAGHAPTYRFRLFSSFNVAKRRASNRFLLFSFRELEFQKSIVSAFFKAAKTNTRVRAGADHDEPAGPSRNQAPLAPGRKQAPHVPGWNQAPHVPGWNQAPLAPGWNQTPLAPGRNQAPLAPGRNQAPLAPGWKQAMETLITNRSIQDKHSWYIRRWKNYLLSAYYRVVHNVWHACFRSFTDRPLLLGLVFLSILTVPHAKMTGILCETSLLAKEKADHFKAYAKDPVVFMIFDRVDDLFYVIIRFSQMHRVSKGNSSTKVAIA